jgi:hypothetical protein
MVAVTLDVTNLTTPTSFVKDADAVDSNTNVLEIALNKDVVLVAAALMLIKRAINFVTVVFTPTLISLPTALTIDTVLLVTIVLITPTLLSKLAVPVPTTDSCSSLSRPALSVTVAVDVTAKVDLITAFNILAVDVPVAVMYLATDLIRLTVDVTAAVRVCNTFFVPKEAKDDWAKAAYPNIT